MRFDATLCSLVQMVHLREYWCNLVQLGADWSSLVQLGADWCILV